MDRDRFDPRTRRDIFTEPRIIPYELLNTQVEPSPDLRKICYFNQLYRFEKGNCCSSRGIEKEDFEGLPIKFLSILSKFYRVNILLIKFWIMEDFIMLIDLEIKI